LEERELGREQACNEKTMSNTSFTIGIHIQQLEVNRRDAEEM
jgi:hypothetical protein